MAETILQNIGDSELITAFQGLTYPWCVQNQRGQTIAHNVALAGQSEDKNGYLPDPGTASRDQSINGYSQNLDIILLLNERFENNLSRIKQELRKYFPNSFFKESLEKDPESKEYFIYLLIYSENNIRENLEILDRFDDERGLRLAKEFESQFSIRLVIDTRSKSQV